MGKLCLDWCTLKGKYCVKIFVYSASLREDSVNLRLSKLIAKVAEAYGAEVDFARINDFDMPVYNFDVQQSDGIPPGTLALADRIKSADGMILTSPEYNWLPPASIKNAVDWLSRIKPGPLDKKSILLSSASPSLAGGVKGLMTLRISFEALAHGCIRGRLRLPRLRRLLKTTERW